MPKHETPALTKSRREARVRGRWLRALLGTLLAAGLAGGCTRSTPTGTEGGRVPGEAYAPHLTPATAERSKVEPGPPFLQPFVRNRTAPGANAGWRPDIGLPDEGGRDRFGLLLETGQGRGTEVGIRVLGVEGLASLGPEVSFDYRGDGTCTRTSPRIVITRSDGQRAEYGCADGKQSPVAQAPGWTHVVMPIADLPPGVTIGDFNIVFNIPNKSVVIDNFKLITWVLGWPGLSLYVADTGNDRIVRVDNWIDSGWFANWTTFGSGGSGVNQLNGPEDVFVDRLGRIYIADTGNNRVVRINDMTGAGWTVLGGTCGLGANQLCFPSSVYVDGSDRIYVAEASGHALSMAFVPNNRVVRVNDMAGAGWVALGSQGNGTAMFHGPTGVHLDGAWRIHVADFYNQRIVRMDDMTGAGWGSRSATPGCWINQARGVFADASYVYFGDGDVKRISDISGTGCALFSDSPSHDAHSVATDAKGRIYFSESYFDHRISRLRDITGAGHIMLGSLGSGFRQFNSPRGIHVEGLEPSPAFR